MTSGFSETGNDFGNFRQGTKSGIKYEDDNADGNQDAGEDPLSGWVIRAYSDTNGDGILQAGETTIADSDTTTGTGAYELQLDPGKYVVCEVLQSGLDPARARRGERPLRRDLGPRCRTATRSRHLRLLRDRQRLRQLPRRAPSPGIKYEDDNADGNQDAGEDPLSGWVIRAYADDQRRRHPPGRRDHDRRLRHHHRATGAYELQLDPGKYVVCEVLQAGWIQGEPVSADNRCAAISGLGADGYAIDVTSGFTETGNDFGNFRGGTKSGIKYEDDNADGNQDAGEDPLSGWVIRAYSDANGDGALQAGETTIADSDTTTATGAYELQLDPGNYVVCEVLQANWFQREPVEANNRCAAIVGPRSGRLRPRRDLGLHGDRQRLRQLPPGHQVRHQVRRRQRRRQPGRRRGPASPAGSSAPTRTPTATAPSRPARPPSPTPTPPPPTGAYELQLDPGKYVVCEVLQAGWIQGEPVAANNRCAAISGLGAGRLRDHRHLGLD